MTHRPARPPTAISPASGHQTRSAFVFDASSNPAVLRSSQFRSALPSPCRTLAFPSSSSSLPPSSVSAGHSIPLLGLGVYQNRTECYSACLAALKAGYRFDLSFPASLLPLVRSLEHTVRPLLTLRSFSPRRHIDSAQVYQNEAEVGRAVRDSGIPREEVFISQSTHELFSVKLDPT